MGNGWGEKTPLDDLIPPVETLGSYFLAWERYKQRKRRAMLEIEDLRYSYTKTSTDEALGLTMAAAGVEERALEIVELEEELKKARRRAEKKLSILQGCLACIPQRWEMLLNTFYSTGKILTTRTELKQAQERLAYELGLYWLDQIEIEKERRIQSLRERVQNV